MFYLESPEEKMLNSYAIHYIVLTKNHLYKEFLVHDENVHGVIFLKKSYISSGKDSITEYLLHPLENFDLRSLCYKSLVLVP